jgi:hypothetical protein
VVHLREVSTAPQHLTYSYCSTVCLGRRFATLLRTCSEVSIFLCHFLLLIPPKGKVSDVDSVGGSVRAQIIYRLLEGRVIYLSYYCDYLRNMFLENTEVCMYTTALVRWCKKSTWLKQMAQNLRLVAENGLLQNSETNVVVVYISESRVAQSV